VSTRLVVSDLFAFLVASPQDIEAGGWKLVRRGMHDGNAHQMIVLTEDGGPAPEIAAADGIGASAWGFSNVQVRVRGNPWDGDSARAKLAEVFDLLDSRPGLIMNDQRYDMIQATTTEPAAFMDDKGRWNLTQVFTFTWHRALTEPNGGNGNGNG
jgi:hypothetical protein